jgi:hypothetical protein
MVNAGYEARSELALKRAQLERLKQKLSRPPQQQPETDLDRARRRLAALR